MNGKGYTKVDNWLFDVVMPAAKPTTYKIVSIVVRCTSGWNKESDAISLSQFQKMSGIKGRSNVINAIQDAINCGFIEREPAGMGYIYRTSHGTVPKQSRNVTSTSHGTGLETSHGTGHTKEQEIQSKGDSDPLLELVNHFCDVSHCRKPSPAVMENGRYKSHWLEPLVAIYHATGDDFSSTKERITEAVGILRDGNKKYTITTPASIQNTAVNLKHGGGKLKVKAI